MKDIYCIYCLETSRAWPFQRDLRVRKKTTTTTKKTKTGTNIKDSIVSSFHLLFTDRHLAI